jgi:hypothetical protein
MPWARFHGEYILPCKLSSLYGPLWKRSLQERTEAENQLFSKPSRSLWARVSSSYECRMLSTKPASAIVVGSGIIEGTRHYYYNDSKVPKSRHEELVTEVLGFSDSSTNTLSWFIRQRSIQSLVCPRLDTIGFNLVPNNSIATSV